MGSFSILGLLVLFCLIPSCLILLWSSSQTAGTWWEATGAAVYSQKQSTGFFTGGSPPGNNNSPALPHGHGEGANHYIPSWLFSASAAACPSAGAGEAPTSGCISCQGDGSDRTTYWLLMWLKTCALATFLGRCAKLAWTVFVLMVWRQLEAKRNALPGPPAPVLGDDDEEGAPANVAEAEARVPPPPPQGTENVPNAADAAAGTGAEVKPSSIVAATVSGSALLLSLMPPPPLPARSISAPARLVPTPVDLAAEGTICGDVSPAALA
ncbi:unnamed protein product [Ectocarpus sp. 4 AP-2014]